MKEFECQFCGRFFTNRHSHNGHVSHCKPNSKRDRTWTPGGWNKGLTKESHDGLARGGRKYSEKVSTGEIQTWSTGKTKETDPRVAAAGRKISETLLKKSKEGTWHNSFSRAKTYEYKGLRLYGKWELSYAQFLDANQKVWRRPEESFLYVKTGEQKQRRYTPDFYLYEENCYVEIKGYPTERDFAKWSNFPLPLLVLFGEDLKKLRIIEHCRRIAKVDLAKEMSKIEFVQMEIGWYRCGPIV